MATASTLRILTTILMYSSNSLLFSSFRISLRMTHSLLLVTGNGQDLGNQGAHHLPVVNYHILLQGLLKARNLPRVLSLFRIQGLPELVNLLFEDLLHSDQVILLLLCSLEFILEVADLLQQEVVLFHDEVTLIL